MKQPLKNLVVQLLLAAGALSIQPQARAHGDVPEGDFKLQQLLADARTTATACSTTGTRP